MAALPRPFPNCYWVEPGRLLAGEYPGARDEAGARPRLAALLEAGLTDFVDLTSLDDPLRPYAALLQAEAAARGLAARYTRLAIPDMDVPASPAHMRRILDTLDEAHAAGRSAYLHCWGGIGRTGTVVGCYLVRRGLAGQAALDQLAAWWRTVPKSLSYPRSPQTDEQLAYVRGWREPAE